jgi:hypothetical protein
LVIFVILIPVLFIGTLTVGGAIVGAKAGAANPQRAQQAGFEAGQKFGNQYGLLIFLTRLRGFKGMFMRK